MSQEIKVGSRWEHKFTEYRAIAVHINSDVVVIENSDLSIGVVPMLKFLREYVRYIEPKPPLKVEAWVYDDGEVRYYLEGAKLTGLWKREPRLDYEVV